jgi:O-acetyl-ADP-ribose deacetylase (regulator of RNase III)
MRYEEISGDLIELAKQGKFDVIAHGVNCFCTMGAGIAPQMAKAFGVDNLPLESSFHKGNINKLGQIDYTASYVKAPEKVREKLPFAHKELIIVNAYTQYNFGANHKDGDEKPLDYEALQLCFRKMNHIFKGKHIGLPQIGCGLAGGSWSLVQKYIKAELADCRVTVVIYKPNK